MSVFTPIRNMLKNFLLFLSNLGYLGYLSYLGYLGGTPVFAQESLLVTSHIIRVNQGLREEETFYFGVSEEMEIENRGLVPFEGNLEFWVGEGEDLKMEIDGQTIKPSLKQKVVSVKLPESLKPNQKTRITLDYKVFFTDEKKKKEFVKKILYPHKEKSLQIMVNPVENLGFFPKSGFSFQRSSEESGWFVSPKISPKVGNAYALEIVKGEKPRQQPSPSPRAERKEEKERQPVIVPEKIKGWRKDLGRWLTRYRILILNDVIVLGVVALFAGYLSHLLSRAKLLTRSLLSTIQRLRKIPGKIKFRKRRKSGKRKRKK